MERSCDMTVKYEVDINTEAKAKETIPKLKDELYKTFKQNKYSSASVDIELSHFGKDESINDNYTTYLIDVYYEDDCYVSFGSPSYNWYEPDEPDEIEGEEASDQIIDEIDNAFSKLGIECYDSTIIRNDSQSLDEVLELAINERNEREFECEREFEYDRD